MALFGRLFLAGVMPGLMLTGLFMVWTVFIIWKRGFRSHAIDFRSSWKEKFQSVPKIAPFLAIMTVVGAALGIRASSSDADVHDAAQAAGVSEQDLRGALSSLESAGKSTDPYSYLRSTGELPSLPPSASASPPGAPTSGVWSALARKYRSTQ